MIRKMRESDIEEVVALWLENNISTHHFIAKEYWLSQKELVYQMMLDAEVYLYEEDGILNGFVGLVENYLAGIFVSKNQQSKGIVRDLLNHVKELKKELTLSVYQKNLRAFQFYEREGFTLQSLGIDEATLEAELTMTWQRK